MTEAQETATEAGRAQDIGGEQAGGGIGRAAVLIGAITIVSNIVGFGRQLVFAHTVSATCLGTAYATANQVPNIIYDIVLGGALASVLIPVLAGPAARRLGGHPGPRTGAGTYGQRRYPGQRRHIRPARSRPRCCPGRSWCSPR